MLLFPKISLNEFEKIFVLLLSELINAETVYQFCARVLSSLVLQCQVLTDREPCVYRYNGKINRFGNTTEQPECLALNIYSPSPEFFVQKRNS